MFKQSYLTYVQTISALEIATEIRLPLVAAAVASAIANTFDIPSIPVVSPEAYFNEKHAVSARMGISAFNEQAPLTFELACELARKFWLLRYNVVHGRTNYLFEDGKFAEGFSGIKYLLDTKMLDLLNSNTQAFGKIRHAVLQCKQ
jgi:hypothetical protein